MSFFDPVGSSERDNAIANVKTLGSANASKRDLEIVTQAAKQAGSVGNKAREALKSKK